MVVEESQRKKENAESAGGLRIFIGLTAGKSLCSLVPLTWFLKHFSTGNRTLSATSSLAGCKVYTSSRRAGGIFSLTTSGMVKVPFGAVRRENGYQ